jgi:hypothetical protein
MKRILLMLLLPAMFLSSCKKNSDDPADDIQSKIKGDWSETSSKYEYFNASGTKVFEESVSLGSISFDGGSIVSASYEDEVFEATYSLSKDGSIDYLTISDGEESSKYVIVSITKTKLSLSLETLNDFYYVGTKKVTVAKSILTSTLVKD